MKTITRYYEDPKERRKSGSKGRRHYHPRTRYSIQRARVGFSTFLYYQEVGNCNSQGVRPL